MKYQPRTIKLDSEERRELALNALKHAPLDHNLEVVIRKHVKARTLDQQALLFAGPLKDISEQAWVDGKQFSVEIWHRHYKGLYLPEREDPYIFELVKDCEKYFKWDYLPSGERVLIGSTTDLSKYGYSQYLEQIYADGASMGVLFHSNPKDLIK